MNTDPSSNVRKRDEFDDIPENGDWSALEAKARKDMKASKDAIEKRRTTDDD